MKTYKNQNIASQFATKATKKTGEAHEAFEYMGGWAVVTEAMKAALIAQMAEATELEAQLTPSTGESIVIDAVPTPTSTDKSKVIAMDVLGAYESKGYVYTPTMDGVKRKAKQRWFPAGKVTTVAIPGGLRIVAEARVFTSRDINIATAVDPESALPTGLAAAEEAVGEIEAEHAAEVAAQLEAEALAS